MPFPSSSITPISAFAAPRSDTDDSRNPGVCSGWNWTPTKHSSVAVTVTPEQVSANTVNSLLAGSSTAVIVAGSGVARTGTYTTGLLVPTTTSPKSPGGADT
jgi:hypothetical protein